LGSAHTGKNGFGAHHHARATTEWCIVNSAMSIGGVGAQIVHPQVEQRCGARTTKQAFRTKCVDKRRKNAEHVDAHDWHRVDWV
jgi:hypothetical protein